MVDRYFDDFAVGERFTSRGATVTESQILDFALCYDPQPFHLDIDAAKATPFGGLIASGFQTLALGFRLIYDTGFFKACSVGSPGMDEIRWTRPVRPGDTLRTEAEILTLRPSASKPDRGTARVGYTVRNQDGDIVMTFVAIQIWLRRPSAET